MSLVKEFECDVESGVRILVLFASLLGREENSSGGTSVVARRNAEYQAS